LECGCPLPLSLGGGRDRYFNSQPLAWRSLRFALLAIVTLCLAQARPSLAATTATTNKTSTLDQASFKIVNDNNIFNPKRYAGFQPRQGTTRTQPRQADYFALVGIMQYDKGPFAFFEGSRSEYSKVAKPSDSIAGFKVTAIESNSVQLVSSTNTIALPINMQMRREEGSTEWKLAARSDTYVASNDRTDRSRYDRNGRNRNRDSRDYNQRDNNNTLPAPVVPDGTNLGPDVMVIGPDTIEPPDFPPSDAAVEGQGSGTNEDPVLRLLRLRRERESNP
jgi:hypothetical protein